MISPKKSVVLIPYILQTVVSCRRPGGIGNFFLRLSHNYDLDLMSHYKSVLSSSGRSSSKKFSY